jgi:hypothetical protein
MRSRASRRALRVLDAERGGIVQRLAHGEVRIQQVGLLDECCLAAEERRALSPVKQHGAGNSASGLDAAAKQVQQRCLACARARRRYRNRSRMLPCLPAPDAPMMAIISPGCAAPLTLCRIRLCCCSAPLTCRTCLALERS